MISRYFAALLTAVALAVGTTPAADKPLKVFILAGQSNMQGHANVSTFDSMADDPKTAPLLKEMRDKDGKPKVCDKVWITSVGCLGDAYSDLKEQKGKLTAGFGAGGKDNIGPEFTFGLTMEKTLKEPVLIIKTSWGGRSLHTDFRPPSGGPFVLAKETQELWDKYPQGAHGVPKTEDRPKFWEEKKAATGVYYREMVKHVKAVLKDIKRVVPDYNEKQGYELAGFVWFQGFNDLVDGGVYPNQGKPGGYDLYADLLGHFIRDVRKDLDAPKLPFVVGVMGIDGVEKGKKGSMKHFRDAQRKSGMLDEFKGNVFAVETAPFWDDELDALVQRKERLYEKLEQQFRKADPKPKEPEKQAARKKALDDEFKPEELKRLKVGVSNGGYHYLGAAKILAPIGQAFAEALVPKQPRRDGTLHLLSFGAGAPIKGPPVDDLYGRDAGFIVEAVRRSPSAWKRVETAFVSGLECTPERLLKEVDRLVKEAKPGDLVFIHASTHGTTKRGLLQLDSEKGKIIDADVLSGRLAKLPCPAIVTIDACETGGAVRSALPKQSAWLLGCTETQSTSGQTNDPKVPHGFLVLALCEALRGDADSDSDGLVTIGELFKWVPSRAKDLAKGECEQDAVIVLPADLAKLPLTVALPGKQSPLWKAPQRKAEDWPQFRGPNASGSTKSTDLPTEWSADKNLAWKVKLPGTGLSQPVVVGDKLFVTAAVSDKLNKPKSFGQGVIETGRERLPDVEIDWQVVALDRATGKRLWAKSATKGKPKHPVHACNSYATETPCADAERAYAYFGATGTVVAFDHAGKELWKEELGAYPTVSRWGSGASPTLGGGKLFVTSFSQESAFVVALDCKTGKEAWRSKWADKGLGTSWSSPLVWTNSKRTELVVCGPGSVSAHALDTGNELWRMSGFQPFYSSPTIDGDTLYVANGGQSSGGPLLGIKAGASGDITPNNGEKPSEFVAWNVTAGGAGWSSPLAQNGYLYVPGKGTLTCYDAKTGKQMYNERVPKMNRLIACPVGTGDHVLVLDELGAAAMVKAGPKFEVVGAGKIDDVFWSSPAIAGGDLYLRGTDYLYCVRQVKSQ